MTGGAGLALALVLGVALYRVLRGPHVTDRVLGLDLIAWAAIGLVALRFVETRQAGLVDGALVIGALGFLTTVALARAIEQLSGPGPRGDLGETRG